MKTSTKDLATGIVIGILICITASLITVASYDESKAPTQLKNVNFFQNKSSSNENTAIEKPKTFCGDNICGASENCAICENDCGKCPDAGSSNTTTREEKTNASNASNNSNNIPDNPPNNPPVKLTCPPSCDDKKPCTEDLCSPETNFQCVHKALNGEQNGCSGNAGACAKYSCSDGACIQSQITPCEGNGICEPGESLKSADCWYCPKGYSQCINCKRTCPYNIFVK